MVPSFVQYIRVRQAVALLENISDTQVLFQHLYAATIFVKIPTGIQNLPAFEKNSIFICDVATWSGAGGAKDGVRLVVSLADMSEFEVRSGSDGGTAGT